MKMKSSTRIFLFFFFLASLSGRCVVFGGERSVKNLSDSAKVSLVTCSPGNELYSIFGHSAIRVTDPSQKLDVVFNYGTFNFEDPNFYPNFVKGHLNYVLSVYPYRLFEQEYVTEKRWIYEQKLNIDIREKQHLFDSLLINYRPENRGYPYDFLNDNCATRIRDIFVEAIPRKINFDYSSFDKGQSFRELLTPYLTQKPWSKLGINLLMGLPADRVATPWDYMFLPDHLEKAFQHATFVNDSTSQPFAQNPQTILEGNKEKERFCWWAPQWIFILVLLITIAISYKNYKEGSFSFWFDRILLVIAGLLGVLFTFLWVGTAHRSMVWNFNLLWANPLHLLAVFLLSANRFRGWIKVYANINLVILLVLLVGWPFMPQALPWAIYPIVIALALRMFVYSRCIAK